MTIKVNLEKTYDRVRWDFLNDTLHDAGLLESLVKTIIQSVSSASMQLFWNGSLFESFNPIRGVRQGNPLSPYLFILGMERLSHLIEVAIEEGI